MAFALCAREGVDRFQCLLRSGPVAATIVHSSELAADGCLKIIAPKPETLMTCWSESQAGMKAFHRSRFPKIGNRSLTPFRFGNPQCR